MTWSYTNTFTFPAPPEQVFRAWTDPGELTRWFAEQAEVTLAPGGAYRFWGKHTVGCPTAAEARQSLIRIEPNRCLAFTWRLYQTGSEVSVDLAPSEEGTALTLTHTLAGDLGIRRGRELVEDLWRLSCGNLLMHLQGGAGIVLPDYGDPRPEVRQVLMIEAPPAVVWRALTEPKAIQQWFGTGHATVDPRVGGEYNLHWQYQVEGREVTAGTGRILEFEPDRRLVLTWMDWRGDPTVNTQTISFTLEPVGERTRVTFVHAGFERTADISDYPFGWAGFLEGFVAAAEALVQR